MKKKQYKTRSGSSKAKGTTTPVGDLAEEVIHVSVARAKAKGSTPSSKGSSKGTPLPTLPTDPKDYDKKLPAKETTSYHTPVPDPPITPTRIDGRLTSIETGSTTTKSTSKRKPGKKPKVSSPPKAKPILFTPTTYDWDEEDSRFGFGSESEPFTIDMDLLTDPFPHGMFLSPLCKEWMIPLGLTNWETFVTHSGIHSVDSLMRFLSVDQYFTHKSDLRVFLTLGEILSSIPKKNRPSPTNTGLWIPKLKDQLHANFATRKFQAQEREVTRALYEEAHPTMTIPHSVGHGGEMGMILLHLHQLLIPVLFLQMTPPVILRKPTNLGRAGRVLRARKAQGARILRVQVRNLRVQKVANQNLENQKRLKIEWSGMWEHLWILMKKRRKRIAPKTPHQRR